MPVTLVQTAANHSSTQETAITTTFGSAVTAGNCVVACIGGHNLNAITSVVSGSSSPDNWAPAETRDSGQVTAEIWANPACAGGNTQVGATSTVNGLFAVQLFEFSGVTSSSPLDVGTVAGSASLISVWTTGTSRAAQPGDVLVGMCCGYAGSAYSLTGPPGPWTNEAFIATSQSGLFVRMIAGYQILSAGAAMTYSGTADTAQIYSAVAAGLLSASGGSSVSGGSGSFLSFF